MGLLLFHRVLIVSAIALGLLLFVLGLVRFGETHQLTPLLEGCVAAAAGVALGVYLRWFLRKRVGRASKSPP